MGSLHFLSPHCCVFRLMSSLLGPGSLLGPWHLGLYSGYPQFLLPHRYKLPLKILTLYTSPPFPPISELIPFFTSPSSLPSTTLSSSTFQYSFLPPISVELYHPHMDVVFLLLGFHMVCELYHGYSKHLLTKLHLSVSTCHRCSFYQLRVIFSTSKHLPTNFMKSLFLMADTTPLYNISHFLYPLLC